MPARDTTSPAPGRRAGLAALAGAHPVAAMALAALAIAASARIDVPMVPVYMTMQSFTILVAGALMGARRGAGAVALYLAAGITGLPVFQGGGAGPMHFVGPTGGYLVGFVAAAWLAGRLVEARPRAGAVRLTVAFVLGHAVLFLTGLAWLGLYTGYEAALAAGLTPFIPGALVKSALATATVLAARPPRRAPR